MRSHWKLLALALVGVLGARGSSQEISTIATGGNPASLVVYGSAQATASLADGTVLAARAHAGLGRVVAIGHGGFLEDNRGDTRAFLDAQVAWLLEGRREARAWGVPAAMRQRLTEAGLPLAHVSGGVEALDLSRLDLVVASPQAFARTGRLAELEAWLLGGGALLSVETAWGQIQLGHATGAHDLAANTLLGTHGILYTERALSPGRDGLYTLDPQAGLAANASDALALLSGAMSGDVTRAARVVRQALAIAPLDGPLVARADALSQAHAEALEAAYAGMATTPLRLAQQPLACALLDLSARRAMLDAPSGRVAAHPSGAAFPGPVPGDAPRVRRVVTLDDGIPGWRSTGLYAAPGEAVHLRIVDGPEAKATLQIGCWLDPQDFDDRVRMPLAVFRTPVRDGRAVLASPIGGPVYLDLGDTPAGLKVEISGAVEMPRFRLGHTGVNQWQRVTRHLPAPWAELESDHLVFTVPATVVRTLDRPDLVMMHWDQIHTAMQGLEPRSPRHWPDRQYRYVAEQRLSWGYMYCPSDAPVVIPTTEAGAMVTLANFDAQGPNHLWGHYHEMGHAHQNPLWTFEGTGEVTVNIFTVYALHTINGYPLDSEVMRSEPSLALSAMQAHAARGAPFHRWKADPFLALQTYALLWHAFGFEAFHRAFRAYDDMPEARHPRDDAAKRDVFVITMSRAVGHNLEPYFRAWGVPLSDRPARELADLPGWMPPGYEPIGDGLTPADDAPATPARRR
ncbi:MAG: M60 family metallopeptidase [Phycisphaeraceae bacterium]|nr:M60 family metallopeptidase [Phycisphaeraceae bacterium]